MEQLKVRFLEFDQEIVFSREESTKTLIHPDDSIRTIKMKILHELHKGDNANKLRLHPSYEELYLYAFVEEKTSSVQLFDALKTQNNSDPVVTFDVISQMLEGHPDAESILRRVSLTYEDKSSTACAVNVAPPMRLRRSGLALSSKSKPDGIAYSDFESLLSEKELVLSVKTPLGIQYGNGGARDATFAVDPYDVDKHRAYLTEHNNLHYFDDSLLLNYGKIVDNIIYVCLADRVLKSAKHPEYVSRYYFPGLFKSGIDSTETLVAKRNKLVDKTLDLLTERRLQYYQSIQKFYEIAAVSDPKVEYLAKGIKTATFLLKNANSKSVNLELLFRNMHSSKDAPYIKFNPGPRREKLYRFYFERTTSTGKKIPYLSRSQIMRLSKETGRSQQISVYLESVVLSERAIQNCCVHFERTGEVQIQFVFTKPMDENEIDQIMRERVTPELAKLSLNLKSTGFFVPEYARMRDTKVVDMQYVVRTPAKKVASLDRVPCVYSICAFQGEMARLKRVENFREMDEARILVTELYGEVQYGELSLQDIVSELTARHLVDSEETARIIVADVLNRNNELDGEIVERPGFPITMKIDSEEKTMEIQVSNLTSIRYLDTVGIYVDAIIKITQLFPEKHPDLKELNRLCKKASKFKEIEAEQEVAPVLLREATTPPVIMPVKYIRDDAKDFDFFAQFGSDEDEEREEEEYRPPKQEIFVEEENDDSSAAAAADHMLAELRKNARKGPILFEEEDEDEVKDKDKDQDQDGGKPSNNDADDGDNVVPDGIPLKPVNPILRKLRNRDPELFMHKPSGKYKSFSVSCQPTSRHPVILTQDEFDRTDKSAYKHSIKYGSDPKNQHHFICPRFWCFLTNSAISEADVKAGKCGEIIKKNAEKVTKGAYVYELNSRAQYPGFIEDARPDGKCLPCCFKNWDTQGDARERCQNQMMEKEEQEVAANPKKKKTAITQKTAQYIYSLDTYPVPNHRWGYLPIPVQLFLNMDYRSAVDPNNPALLLSKKQVLLRCGVEQPQKQSFLGVFAHIYAKSQDLDAVPSVEEFRKILSTAIDLDAFSKAHNGSLLSVFHSKSDKKKKHAKSDRTKYENTEFALGLDLSTKPHKQYLDDAIAAYQNFQAYLADTATEIDHQYLWDFVCSANARIVPRGLNLVMVEIKANDIIDRIELVCPTNLYSSNQYDRAKDTVIVLKHDEIYEPIFLYESSSSDAEPKVVRFFEAGHIPPIIVDTLKNIELSTKKHCPGMPSLPRIYEMADPVPINKIVDGLVAISAKVETQVLNYQGKTIGLMAKEKDQKTAVYVPCAPSAPLDNIAKKYMDDLDILRDYETTTSALNRISNLAKIPCKPIRKVKEDGLVVGFLTETNQFVPIRPNEDIIMDGLKSYEGVDAFQADKTVATVTKGDRKREKMTKYISLESQFYHAFRNRVRTLLNQRVNRKTTNRIRKTSEEPTLLYKQKMTQIEKSLRDLIEDHIIFVDIDDDVLLDMSEINECDDASDKSPNCLVKENGVAQLVIPKWHLLSKYDNENIYVGRLADELVRNDRVKSFMYDTKTRMNARNVDYSINRDEIILAQSALTLDNFEDTEKTNASKYAKQTNYELANPSISVLHSNEKIPLADQYQPTEEEEAKDGEGDDAHDCLAKMVPIVGNQLQIWRRIFSEDAREHVFRNTEHCTYQPIIRIVEDVLGERWNDQGIRSRLWSIYSQMFEENPELIGNVAGVMRKQGKSKMFERIARNVKMDSVLSEFESIVLSEHYYITDMDIWAIASEYDLPIIIFNPNGLKGFFAKTDVQWIRADQRITDRKKTSAKSIKYHFIRSNIGSYPNHIYEYNLVVPPVKLSDTKEFEDKMVESMERGLPNTQSLEETLSKIVFVETKALKK